MLTIFAVLALLTLLVTFGAPRAGFTDFLEDKILNHCFRATDYAEPATVYAALFTATPSDTGGGTEATGGSYARTAITFGAPSPSGAIANSGAVTFPTASADWGVITHFAIMDASTAGNMMAWAAVADSKTVDNGDTASFAIGDIDVTLD